MPQITINFSEDEDQKIEIYKALHKLSSKEQAVKQIVAKTSIKVNKDGSLTK